MTDDRKRDGDDGGARILSASTAAFSTRNLPKKPNSGGTPASENIVSDIRKAYHGAALIETLEVVDLLGLEAR